MIQIVRCSNIIIHNRIACVQFRKREVLVIRIIRGMIGHS
ncbi:hypothetical protein WZ342_2511 [Enterococcus faecalis]|nr:hypothetical protein WZ342_2511 [Enterococcus faecalis]